MTDVTRILHAIEGGDLQATDELLPVVYNELRRLAAQRLPPTNWNRGSPPARHLPA